MTVTAVTARTVYACLGVRSRHLVDRIQDEFIWLGCPGFTDVFVRCEAAERLEAARVVVGIEEIVEMRAELVMAIVVIPFDGSVFNRAVHALDLPVRPRVVWLGQAMLNAICCASDFSNSGNGLVISSRHVKSKMLAFSLLVYFF